MPHWTPTPIGAPRRRAGEFTELVQEIVAAVPSGRATTYGLINEAIAAHRGDRGSALSVGAALARTGMPLPWWRVVRADGSIDHRLAGDAHPRWRAEGLPTLGAGDTLRIDLHRCLWDTPVEWAPGASTDTATDADTDADSGSDTGAETGDAGERENDDA